MLFFWGLIDNCGSGLQGEIETGEFFEGLAKMKGTAQSKDIFRLQKTIDSFCGSTSKDDEDASQRVTPRNHKSPRKVSATSARSSSKGSSPRAIPADASRLVIEAQDVAGAKERKTLDSASAGLASAIQASFSVNMHALG